MFTCPWPRCLKRCCGLFNKASWAPWFSPCPWPQRDPLMLQLSHIQPDTSLLLCSFCIVITDLTSLRDGTFSRRAKKWTPWRMSTWTLSQVMKGMNRPLMQLLSATLHFYISILSSPELIVYCVVSVSFPNMSLQMLFREVQMRSGLWCGGFQSVQHSMNKRNICLKEMET